MPYSLSFLPVIHISGLLLLPRKAQKGTLTSATVKRFLAHLTETELIENILHELPPLGSSSPGDVQPLNGNDIFESSLLAQEGGDAEQGRLFPGQPKVTNGPVAEDEPMSAFVGLNALEIAAIADAKKFLSQRVVQKVVVSFFALLISSQKMILSIETIFPSFCSSHCLESQISTCNMNADSRIILRTMSGTVGSSSGNRSVCIARRKPKFTTRDEQIHIAGSGCQNIKKGSKPRSSPCS